MEEIGELIGKGFAIWKRNLNLCIPYIFSFLAAMLIFMAFAMAMLVFAFPPMERYWKSFLILEGLGEAGAADEIYAQMVVKIQDTRFHPSLPLAGSRPDWYSVRLIQEVMEQPVSKVDLNIDLSKILRNSEHEFSIEFQRDDYYGKKVGIMTVDGEIHQSMIAHLESRLCSSLGTCAEISDRRNEYVNAIGLAQLILTWNCTEKLEHLLGRGRASS
mgnify:CR=1 FL=1